MQYNCHRCNRKLEIISKDNNDVLTFGVSSAGSSSSDLANILFDGIVCSHCGLVLCSKCKGLPFDSPCTNCGNKVSPAYFYDLMIAPKYTPVEVNICDNCGGKDTISLLVCMNCGEVNGPGYFRAAIFSALFIILFFLVTWWIRWVLLAIGFIPISLFFVSSWNIIKYKIYIRPMKEKDSSYWIDRGNFILDKKDYDAAIFYYKKAVEVNPNSHIACYNIGIAYSKKENISKSNEYLDKSIKINPQHADSYFYKGINFHKIKDYDTAISYFEKVIELDPNETFAYFNIGAGYQGKKDFNKAAEYYRKTIELDPQDMDAYYKLGEVLLEKNERQKAEEAFKNAAKLGHEEAQKMLKRNWLWV